MGGLKGGVRRDRGIFNERLLAIFRCNAVSCLGPQGLNRYINETCLEMGSPGNTVKNPQEGTQPMFNDVLVIMN